MPFWLRTLLYLLPFATVFFTLTGYNVTVGESMPLSWVVDTQAHDREVLYRPRYGNRDQQFKTLAINMRHPEIIAIGSSRILQFRAGFFNRNPDAFYNAAGPGWTLTQVTNVLYGIEPSALPDVVILAIDPPWFNDAYVSDVFPPYQSDMEHIVQANRAFLSDLVNGVPIGRGGVPFQRFIERRVPGTDSLALGMRAIRDGHGFRSDGSELYGDFLVAGWLNMVDVRNWHRGWMREGRNMYVFGSTISNQAMSELNELLTWARANEITVIGFLPSYLPDLWNEMVSRGNHSYIAMLTPVLAALFESYGYPFFDFSYGLAVDTYENEFFDGWHASERSNLRLYIRMLEAEPQLLGRYSNLDALRTISSTPGSTWDVFGLDGLRNP